MTKQRKPRAWRGFMCDFNGTSMSDSTKTMMVRKSAGKRLNNVLVIPDGADLPLPAHVRRLVRSVLNWQNAYRNGPMEGSAENRLQLSHEVDAYRKAEQRRKGKK